MERTDTERWPPDKGFSYLLGPNAKLAKGVGRGIMGAVMHLAPATLADGKHTVCPWSTAGCRAACLNTSGRGRLWGALDGANLGRSRIHRARIARTLLYLRDRPAFLRILGSEVAAVARRAERRGMLAAVRLNGTSDVPWESVRAPFAWLHPGAPPVFAPRSVVEAFPGVQFYDYTKSVQRAERFARGEWPTNYHLTYSLSEVTRDCDAARLLGAGVNVAVVFRGHVLPASFLGFPVIDGTEHDWRFLDPRGVVVGLLEKGRAKRDDSGFVVAEGDPAAERRGELRGLRALPSASTLVGPSMS